MTAASAVCLFEIADRLSRFAERVGPVDDRSDLSGFDQLFENDGAPAER